MATLESDKVDEALEGKMKCEVDRNKKDHNYFYLRDNGRVLSRTKISKGSKHTISDDIVSKMAKQLLLGTSKNLVELVKCTLGREEALVIIRAAAGVKPGTPSEKTTNQETPKRPSLAETKKLR